ncbi:hypothetical protein EMCRGX_G028845 [Ephydatia muelleri]
MVGLVHCAPEAARENFNKYEDSTQQDEPLYDDEDDNDEDDDGGDDDDEEEDQEEEGMKRRSADVEFDDPAGGSTGVDTSTDTISGATDGGKDKQGGAPSAGNSCTKKTLKTTIAIKDMHFMEQSGTSVSDPTGSITGPTVPHNASAAGFIVKDTEMVLREKLPIDEDGLGVTFAL